MSHPAFSIRPGLLMLSHCVPSSHGHAEQARAWQLLRLASCSHRVHLICVVDAPVDLRQWRALSALAHELELVQATWLSRAIECGAVWVKEPRNSRMAALQQYSLPLHRHFGAVLYTHARLAPLAGKVPARVRVGDLAHPRQRAERWESFERQAADRGDIFLVASPEDTEMLAIPRAQIRLVPPATDIEPPSAAADEGWDGLHVMLHADWRYAASRRAARRFRRRVWPLVQRVIPTAVLTTTHKAIDPVSSLDSAAVVVVPVDQPDVATWPLVQAMARAKAVVAPASAAEHLDVRCGRELLLADGDADLARACIRLVRLASLRCELGHRAWLHVDQHLSIQPRTLPLVPAPLTQATAAIARAVAA